MHEPAGQNNNSESFENADSTPPKTVSIETTPAEAEAEKKPTRGRKPKSPEAAAVQDNKVVRLLEKNPLGMTLPEMAGGPRQVKKIKLLRPMLAEAIRTGQVMPVSQRAGATVYRLVKYLGPR